MIVVNGIGVDHNQSAVAVENSVRYDFCLGLVFLEWRSSSSELFCIFDIYFYYLIDFFSLIGHTYKNVVSVTEIDYKVVIARMPFQLSNQNGIT